VHWGLLSGYDHLSYFSGAGCEWFVTRFNVYVYMEFTVRQRVWVFWGT